MSISGNGSQRGAVSPVDRCGAEVALLLMSLPIRAALKLIGRKGFVFILVIVALHQLIV